MHSTKTIQAALMIAISFMTVPSCFATCDCTEWIARNGYCVDYIKTRIGKFPVPQSASEIMVLKNREPDDVEEGDVAIFTISNYWHVAYVEGVNKDTDGNVSSIDVSEMNYGPPISSGTLASRWGLTSPDDLRLAACCGITENYNLVGNRANIPVQTIKQVWTPDSLLKRLSQNITETIKETVSRIKELAVRSL